MSPVPPRRAPGAGPAPLSPRSRRFWSTVVRLAWRDLRSSPKRAIVAVLAVAVGACAITAVRALSADMRAKLKGDAREWIAADLSVILPDAPSPEEWEALNPLERAGVRKSLVTEAYTMASSSQVPDSALVLLKAVDPGDYPFYGKVVTQPPLSLRQALQEDTVVISRDLQAQLRVNAGQMLRLGRAVFRVSAVIESLPDWSSGTSTVLPRVLLAAAAFRRAGLALQGNGTYKLLFQLGPAKLEDVRPSLERIFAYADVVDYRDPDPKAAAAFEHAAKVLTIAAWMALAFGSLYLTIILYLHTQRRIDAIAILKALGARTPLILAIYALQALGLAMAGGLLGGVAAMPAELLLVAGLHKFFPISLTPHWYWAFAAQAVAVGALAVIPSVIGPILRIRKVPPLRVMRRESPGMTVRSGVVRLPGGLPLWLRLGARNLFRSGTHSTAIGLSLAAGTAMLVATHLCQQTVSEKVAQAVPAGGANLYIVSTTSARLDEAVRWLDAQPAVRRPPQRFPLVWLHLKRINGKPAATVSRSLPGRWLSTCSDQVPPGAILLSNAASELHLTAGDRLEFLAKGHVLTGEARQEAQGYLESVVSVLTFPCSAFTSLPVFYHAGVTVDPGKENALRRALGVRFPTLPNLSRSEFTAFVQQIADQAAHMMQFVSWAVLVLGLLMQALLVTAARRLRQQEMALTKALGARPRLLLSIVTAEFGLLGLLAGTGGSLAGATLASLLLSSVLERKTLVFDPLYLAAAAAATAGIAALGGCAASLGMLNRKPLEILREE